MGQIRLKLNTTLSERGIAGKALKMHKEEKTQREAIKISLGIIYGALAIAKEGATLEEVKKAIQKNRSQFEIYQSLALSEVEVKISSKKCLEETERVCDCAIENKGEGEIISPIKNTQEIANRDFSGTNNLLRLDDEEL